MLTLYHGTTSICSVKVRLALAEIGLEYESKLIDLQKGEQFTPNYVAINPNAQVPTLIDGALTLIESSLIIEYLDKHYNGARFMPTEVHLESRVRLWLLRSLSIHSAASTLSFATVMRDKALANKTPAEIEAGIQRNPDPVQQAKRRSQFADGLASAHVTQALQVLRRTFEDMSDNLERAAWISGPEIGLADIGLAAYIDRLDRLGFAGLWSEHFPDVGRWLQTLQRRESYAIATGKFISQEMSQAQRDAGLKHWPELSQRFKDILAK